MPLVEGVDSGVSNLARKFVSAVLDQTNGDGRASEAFRAILLGATLKHAWERSPFYQERLPGKVQSGCFSLSELCELPILSKVELSEHHLALRTSDEPGIIQNTTGTTGIPVSVYRTDSEIKFLKTFSRCTFELLSRIGPGEKPLALEISSAYHGDVISLPRQQHVLTTGLFDSVLLDQAARWLTSSHLIPHVEPHVSILSGVYHLVEWFTLLLHQRNFPFDRCAIKQVFTGGGYVTDRWRSILERAWNATVTTVYSLTEVFTRAASCDRCNGYHFLPNVIPELVDPLGSGTPTSKVGQLLLTGLFPFAQGQPAIRYETGDLFRKEVGICEFGDSYFFLGRVKHSACVNDPRGSLVVLGSAELTSALDELPHISRSAHLAPLFGSAIGRDIGRPIFKIGVDENSTNERQKVSLSVLPTFDPFLFPDGWADLRTKCEVQLRARFPSAFGDNDVGAILNVQYARPNDGELLTAIDERATVSW